MKIAIYSLIITISIILALVMLSILGINPLASEDQIINKELTNEESKIDLKKFFPNTPYGWNYGNDSNYIRILAIDEIYENKDGRNIKLTGQEEDLSIVGKNPPENFKMEYIISDDEVIEKFSGKSINNFFSKSTILKKPISVNNKWSDEWILNNGEKVIIESQIQAIENNGERIIVEYWDLKKTFLEKRIFEKDLGITSYFRMEEFDGMKYEISYKLNDSSMMSNFGVLEYFSYLDKKNKHSDYEIKEPTEREKIEGLIINYSNSWIEYVNDGNKKIFQYVIKDGSADKILREFQTYNMKQILIKLDITKIVIEEGIANAYVREEIESTVEGEKEVESYNWIYELNKVDEEWLIQGYKEE